MLIGYSPIKNPYLYVSLLINLTLDIQPRLQCVMGHVLRVATLTIMLIARSPALGVIILLTHFRPRLCAVCHGSARMQESHPQNNHLNPVMNHAL